MTAFSDLTKSLQVLVPSNEQWEFVAFMGNANGVVAADKKNNVWVLRHDKTELIVRNTKVPNQAKLLVVVGYDKSSADSTLLQVLRQVNAYLDPPYPPVANHAEISHKRWGYDPVWITHDQILPGLAYPKEQTGMIVSLRGFNYFLNGYHTVNNGVVDFSTHIPTSGARWVVAEIDENKTITLRDGDILASRELLTPEDIPHPVSDKASCFALKCYLGQLRVIATEKDSDIYDCRFTGVSSGGLATSVDWSAITGKPLVFPPDTDITDLIYTRKWLAVVDPGNNDDDSHGYEILDHWVNTTTGDIFTCADNTDTAAVWTLNGSGGTPGSGGGLGGFAVDGTLAVTTEATTPLLITADTTISSWKLYLRELGSSGSTILDVILKRVGEADISIFTDGMYIDNRPEIQWDDADHLLDATPIIVDFLAGDVLELSIDQVAVDASDIVLTPIGVASLSSLEVTDGATSILHTNKLTVNGLVLTDGGGGNAVLSGFIPSHFPIFHFAPDSNVNYGIIASGLTVWLQSSGALDDEAVWNISLPSGTYTMQILQIPDSDRGKYHWYIDGSEVGSADGYGSPAAFVVLEITGGVVPTTGEVEIKVKMASKNASSSAYYGTIFGLSLKKTA